MSSGESWVELPKPKKNLEIGKSSLDFGVSINE
jgi:hypothetical protein